MLLTRGAKWWIELEVGGLHFIHRPESKTTILLRDAEMVVAIPPSPCTDIPTADSPSPWVLRAHSVPHEQSHPSPLLVHSIDKED